MAVTITTTVTPAYTWSSGEVVTPTKLTTTGSPTAATTVTTGADTVLGSVAGGAASEISCTSAGRALIDDASASAQRTTLGLGTVATQDASAIALTGGSAALDNYYANDDTLTYGSTTTIDLSTAAKTVQTVSLTGNVTFQTSNRSSGRMKFLRIIADSSTRTFSFPAWKFMGSQAPGAIAANKTATLTLICFGTAETDILASYIVEP